MSVVYAYTHPGNEWPGPGYEVRDGDVVVVGGPLAWTQAEQVAWLVARLQSAEAHAQAETERRIALALEVDDAQARLQAAEAERNAPARFLGAVATTTVPLTTWNEIHVQLDLRDRELAAKHAAIDALTKRAKAAEAERDAMATTARELEDAAEREDRLEARCEALEAALREAENDLTWMQMAMSWAVFREPQSRPPYFSAEMRDIEKRLGRQPPALVLFWLGHPPGNPASASHRMAEPAAQLQLVPAPPKLTDRQARALKFIREQGTAGARPHAIGLAAGSSETWAKTAGLEIARALKRKGLLRQKRGLIFAAIDAKPDAAFGEFPEGF